MKDTSIGMGKIRKRARRGVSLIEILVVLVLLVLGILIIVRLYPSGFFSITSVGNAALADSLGQAAVQSQAQNATGLPESILPVNTKTKDLSPASAADASYDSDDPALLDKARVINNETITIPAASGATRQSVYIVNYGPLVMPVLANDANLPKYLSINSSLWTAVAGTVPAAGAADPHLPQHEIYSRQERFLVDLANKQIAVPYAAYTNDPAGTKTTAGTIKATSYAQKMVVMILASDGYTYTQYLNVLPGTPKDDANPYAPDTTANSNLAFLPDTTTNYQGGWFDPTKQYLDNSPNVIQAPPPPAVTWKAVMLYRAFHAPAGTVTSSNSYGFSADPYEFTLTSPNIIDTVGTSLANVGAIVFNPLAAGGSGSSALKARISYLTYSWKVLHEDRNIPALPAGNTSVERLTLKNLKRAGDSNPDNSIYSGLIPNSFKSMIALDLDTGRSVGDINPSDPTMPPVADPTALEGNIWDEDVQGPSPKPNDSISVSFSTGRVTFGSNAFGDNLTGSTPHAHRVRLFYVGDADWTVAVQKAPSYFTLGPISATGSADPMLLPGQYAFDGVQTLYFPRSDAGKSVEIDGTYQVGSGTAAQLKTFAATIAIPAVVTTVGTSSYVAVDLTNSTLTGGLSGVLNIPQNSIAVTAVRGLSVRSVVAWKERDRWKVHSVDTLLNRAQ